MVDPFSTMLTDAATAFLTQASACATIDALDRLFQRFARALGFEGALYINLSSAGAPVSPRVVFGGEDEWITHYAAQNYAQLDPTIPRAFQSRKPFTWRDAERRGAPRSEKQFFGEAREIWAEDGLIVPIHGPFGEFSVVNLLSRTPIKVDDEQAMVLQGVCHMYVTAGHNLIDGVATSTPEPMPTLSLRERQCVYWMTMGKHDVETAIILSISVNTVNGYLSTAKTKLGVQTRAALSLKALVYGLLIPDRAMMA
jgi:DNA-binding CsgD family transcriptional regulator